jgi:hypothetical protein
MLAGYTRLYTGDDGESHFEDLEVELVPQDFAPPAAPLNVGAFLPTAGSFWVGAPVGWAGQTPHPAPRRQVFCTVAGEYEVTASDGSVRSFPAGSVLVLEDTWGRGHATRITSEEDALVFAVALAD